MEQIKNCNTCGHCSKPFYEYAKCYRTGWFCNIEMQYGGYCNTRTDLVYWTPRPEKKLTYTKLREWWNAKFNSESKSS